MKKNKFNFVEFMTRDDFLTTIFTTSSFVIVKIAHFHETFQIEINSLSTND